MPIFTLENLLNMQRQPQIDAMQRASMAGASRGPVVTQPAPQAQPDISPGQQLQAALQMQGMEQQAQQHQQAQQLSVAQLLKGVYQDEYTKAHQEAESQRLAEQAQSQHALGVAQLTATTKQNAQNAQFAEEEKKRRFALDVSKEQTDREQADQKAQAEAERRRVEEAQKKNEFFEKQQDRRQNMIKDTRASATALINAANQELNPEMKTQFKKVANELLQKAEYLENNEDLKQKLTPSQLTKEHQAIAQGADFATYMQRLEALKSTLKKEDYDLLRGMGKQNIGRLEDKQAEMMAPVQKSPFIDLLSGSAEPAQWGFGTQPGQ